MIGLVVSALALTAAQPVEEPPVAESVTENEIVVIANKLRRWRSTFKVRKGEFVCKTKRSTGDKAIDAVGCDAILTCATPLVSQWQAIEDAKVPRKMARARLNALLNDNKFPECLHSQREAGIAVLAAERRRKRT